jgi:5-methylcytosine-specific restriction protein B
MIEKKFGSITKAHLIQAFEQFETQKNEYPDSSFYNVQFNGKEFPPKPIVSIAYKIALGEEIKTTSFAGGKNTPAFNLLEKYGFNIVDKKATKKNMSEQVMVYEVKVSASKNAQALTNKNESYFYWNNTTFKNLIIGDYVIVVNVSGKKVLFTKLDLNDIEVKHNSKDETEFIDNGVSYSVSGKFNPFVRMKILNSFQIPFDWKWKSLGSSETTYLNGNRVNSVKGENRILNIEQLKQLSDDIEFNQVLDACLLNFSVTNGLIPEIVAAIQSDYVQNSINEVAFKFQKASDYFKYFKNLKEPREGFYKSLQEKYLESESTYSDFIKTLSVDSEEYKLIYSIGKLISYIDVNAANKNELNEYDDNRTLAKTGVNQTIWLKYLLEFKVNNDYSAFPSTIKSALIYLEDSTKEITLFSVNHREMVALNLLKQPSFNKDEFVNQFINFFKPYGINPINPLNYNRILSEILYRFPDVEKLWKRNDKVYINATSISKDFFEITQKSGLKFSEQLIKRFIASLTTKPFVILSGLSGSGKTKIAQSFVEWMCESENQYKIVPVGADWTNREPLLGYPNGLVGDEYITPDSGVILLLMEAIKEENDSKPFFLILDEMNLSHVERYFADFLSIMESNDTIKLYTGAKRKSLDGLEIDLEIGWPKNVFIIGTVNIDETTYMFSPKVLDRANVIEFRISDSDIQTFLNEPTILKLDNLKGKGIDFAESFLSIAHSDEIVKNDELTKELLLFFNHLQLVGAEFGYRSASEIMLLVSKIKYLQPKIKTNEALDIAIMQKLLPKLHGSRSKLVKILIALSALCVEDIHKVEFEKKFDDNYKNNFIGIKIKYPISFEKIIRMYKNVLANGFTSYAEA